MAKGTRPEELRKVGCVSGGSWGVRTKARSHIFLLDITYLFMICKRIRPGFDVTFGHIFLSLNNVSKLGSWQVDNYNPGQCPSRSKGIWKRLRF